jgi:hypothetical protein
MACCKVMMDSFEVLTCRPKLNDYLVWKVWKVGRFDYYLCNYIKIKFDNLFDDCIS